MWFFCDGTGYTLCCLAHGELAWLFLEPHTGLDHCPRILLSCYRARTSASAAPTLCFLRRACLAYSFSWAHYFHRPRPPLLTGWWLAYFHALLGNTVLWLGGITYVKSTQPSDTFSVNYLLQNEIAPPFLPPGSSVASVGPPGRVKFAPQGDFIDLDLQQVPMLNYPTCFWQMLCC